MIGLPPPLFADMSEEVKKWCFFLKKKEQTKDQRFLEEELLFVETSLWDLQFKRILMDPTQRVDVCIQTVIQYLLVVHEFFLKGDQYCRRVFKI